MAAISPNVSSGPYTADGTQTEFPFAFSIATAAELAVEIDGAVISPALYAVAFGDTTGTVTFLSAPATGARILILSAPDFTQASEFENQGAYNLSTVNVINRRASIRDVVLNDMANRAVKVPLGEAGPTIPKRADRTDKLAAFDNAGNVEALPIAASTLNVLAGLQAEIVAIADNIVPIDVIATDLVGPDTIGTVATNIANVNVAGGSIINVNAVAGALANIASVAGDLTNVNTVAGSIGSVDFTAGSIANVNAVATDMVLGAGASYILRAPQAAIDAANSAIAAAQTVASVLPVLGRKAALARRDAFLTTNTSAKAVLAADGYYHYINGFSATADHVLSTAELAAGVVNLDLYDPNGGTWTVEQRSASASIVAAASVPALGTQRQAAVTLNAATTILRVAGTRANGTAGLFGAVAVSAGIPATVPQEDEYLAALFEQMTRADGLNISKTWTTTATSGVTPTIIGPSSFLFGVNTPSGQVNFQLTSYVAPTESLTCLIEITSATLAPQGMTVTPLNAKGTGGTTISVNRRFTSSGRFLVTVPATLIGGLPVTEIQLSVDTRASGINGGPSEVVPGSMYVFRGTALPKLRAVPAVIGASISTAADQAVALAATNAATALATRIASLPDSSVLASMIEGILYERDKAQYWVSTSESDAAVGTSPITPKKTIVAVQPLVDPTRNIALRAGQLHALAPNQGQAEYQKYGLCAYGEAPYGPIRDMRVDLSGVTWTNVSGPMWVGGFNFPSGQRQDGLNSAVSSNFATYFIPDVANDGIGQRLAWQCGGANIAANDAAVLATPGSWTIIQTGSSIEDPRNDASNATAHTIKIHLPDGSNPNGQLIKISADRGLEFLSATYTDITAVGCAFKDQVGGGEDPAGAGIPHMRRFKSLDFPAHGWVGAGNFDGFKAIGRPVERSSDQFLIPGRSLGGCLNIFTGVSYPNDPLILRGDIILGCGTFGLQGHTSGIAGYKCVDARHATIKIFNCRTSVGFDRIGVPGLFWTTEESIFRRIEMGPYTDPETGISYQGCDIGISLPDGGKYTVNGGFFYSAATPGGACTFAGFSGTNVLEIGGTPDDPFIIDFNALPIGAPTFFLPTLVVNTNPTVGDPFPTIILHDFIDQTVPNQAANHRKAMVIPTAVAGHKYSDVIIRCVENVHIGDVQINSTDQLPAGLFIGAGCTAGCGNRSGPEIDAAFAAAGKVEGVDYLLSGQSTIVGKYGEILSAPGWK